MNASTTTNSSGTGQSTTEVPVPVQPVETTSANQTLPIDGPPPAYEPTPSSSTNQPGNTDSNQVSSATGTATATAFEAPPPYCLVDPSKIRNTDHLPQYPHIFPPEVIDLNLNSHHHNTEQSSRQANRTPVSAWLATGSNMDIGTDCTFLMAFVIAFFFNWLGFLAVVCLIPTIAARFGAMSGFGLSVAKWITVMRYHDFNNTLPMDSHNISIHRVPPHDPAQNFVFAIVLFAGFFLFVRGLISYIAVKNRAHQQGQTADVFTWY